jgi:hypothetical protein
VDNTVACGNNLGSDCDPGMEIVTREQCEEAARQLLSNPTTQGHNASWPLKTNSYNDLLGLAGGVPGAASWGQNLGPDTTWHRGCFVATHSMTAGGEPSRVRRGLVLVAARRQDERHDPRPVALQQHVRVVRPAVRRGLRGRQHA